MPSSSIWSHDSANDGNNHDFTTPLAVAPYKRSLLGVRSPDENNLPVRPTGKKELVGNWRIESGVQSVGIHFLRFPTNSFFPPRVVYRGLGGMSKSGPSESVLIYGCLPTRKAPHEMGRRLV